MNRLLYFAYGSNMLLERIERRVGLVQKISNYTLQNHILLFNSGFSRLCAYANVQPLQGQSVQGVLYELNERQISILDMHEGYPRNYEKFYKIDTINGNQEIIFGYWTVSEIYKVTGGRPSLEYLNIVAAGALENGLNELYEELFSYKLANYKFKSGVKNARTGKVTKRIIN